jgi:hypothetical protein
MGEVAGSLALAHLLQEGGVEIEEVVPVLDEGERDNWAGLARS